MAGTKEGGLKTAAKIKARDENHYVRIGRLGGQISRGGGFTNNPELARRAGKIGGTRSRRVSKEVFVLDDSEFGEGFNSPTWKDKVLRRIR